MGPFCGLPGLTLARSLADNHRGPQKPTWLRFKRHDAWGRGNKRKERLEEKLEISPCSKYRTEESPPTDQVTPNPRLEEHEAQARHLPRTAAQRSNYFTRNTERNPVNSSELLLYRSVLGV